MNFKRHLLIFVMLVMGCRLFAVAMMKLVNDPTDKLANTLHINDGSVFDFLRHGDHNTSHPTTSKLQAKLKAVIEKKREPIVVTQAPLPLEKKLSAKDIAKILAANDQKAAEDKKTADDKKEKERRKERRKKLEELANKQPNPQPAYSWPTAPASAQPPANNFGYGGPPYPTQQTQQTNSPQTPTSSGNGNVSTLQTPAGASNAVSLATWEAKLVNNPTAALMSNFLNLYHTGKITAAQFYQVLDLMQKSKVSTARQYAVTAAALEQRPEAFDLLAQESFSESNTQILGLANQALQVYQNISDVNVFAQEITSGNLEGKLKATELLNQLVTSYITNKNPPANAKTVLSSLVPLLQSLAATGGNAELQASATSTISLINQLSGTVASL